MAKYCKYCGNKLNLKSSYCPNCGKTNNKEEKIVINEKKEYNMNSFLGLIISAFSILLNLFHHGWIMLALLGIILSYIGLIQIRTKNLNGKYISYIGIILGIMSFVYCFIYWW